MKELLEYLDVLQLTILSVLLLIVLFAFGIIISSDEFSAILASEQHLCHATYACP